MAVFAAGLRAGDSEQGLPPLPVLARHLLPQAPRGARIGLFGGSFDPAHEGHVHVTRHALERLRLDQIWWLVSPGNPLKTRGPAPLAQRVAHAEAVMQHPRVTVTPVEAAFGTRYTADTLAALIRHYPRQRLVWIMGADNLAQFHHWENWRAIQAMMPMAVIARPGEQRQALASVAARCARRARLPARAAASLADQAPPAWCFLIIPMRDISSSRLRMQGLWQARS
jgi:nicotinate-nucleotide adenylyltransferase